MLSMKHLRMLAMAIPAALAVALTTMTTLTGVSADGGGREPQIPEKAAQNYPNLGSRLDQLATSAVQRHRPRAKKPHPILRFIPANPSQ